MATQIAITTFAPILEKKFLIVSSDWKKAKYTSLQFIWDLWIISLIILPLIFAWDETMSNKCDSLKNAIIIEKKPSESNFFSRKNVIPQLQIVEFGSCKSERKMRNSRTWKSSLDFWPKNVVESSIDMKIVIYAFLISSKVYK